MSGYADIDCISCSGLLNKMKHRINCRCTFAAIETKTRCSYDLETSFYFFDR